jgi:hypothetical protein
VAWELGVSKHTIYAWKVKYGGMEVSEFQEVKQLREENVGLKKPVGRSEFGQGRVAVGDSKKRKARSPGGGCRARAGVCVQSASYFRPAIEFLRVITLDAENWLAPTVESNPQAAQLEALTSWCHEVPRKIFSASQRHSIELRTRSFMQKTPRSAAKWSRTTRVGTNQPFLRLRRCMSRTKSGFSL